MSFKNYANIFAIDNFPKAQNTNEFVTFSNTDSTDFELQGTKLVCKNAGNWNLVAQYQLVSYKTSDAKKAISQVDGWVRVNGVDVTDSDATNSVNNVGGVNVLAISVCLSLVENDTVEWGIRSSTTLPRVVCGVRSYVADTGITAPSVILTAQKILDNEFPFKNYANLYSTINGPLLPNTNETLNINNTDTNDFELLDGKVICRNPGKWNILSQYQCFGYADSTVGAQGQIDGWFKLNGINVADSDATWSCNLKDEVGVLAIGGIYDLAYGDELEIGVRSSSLNGCLNAGVAGFMTPTGIRAPSIILTAFKVNGGANMASFTDTPKIVNSNILLQWNYNDSDEFTISGSQIIANRSGTYQFFTQYQLYNYSSCLTGPNGLLDGFFRLNGVDVPFSDATTSSSVLSGVNVLPVASVFELVEGDIIQIGVRLSSIDNLRTVGCKTFIPPSQVRAPSCILTVFRL